MLLCFSLLSTRLRPPSSPGGSGPTEGPALSLKWTMLLLADAKTSNCKPGLLSLSGYAADAGWPPHTNIQCCALTWGSTFSYCFRINTYMHRHTDTHTRTKDRLCCCILPPEGADNVPPSPLASVWDSFRDQRLSPRMLDQQNEPTRQQWAVIGYTFSTHRQSHV